MLFELKMTPMDQYDPCVDALLGSKFGSERFQSRKKPNMRRTRVTVPVTATSLFCTFIG